MIACINVPMDKKYANQLNLAIKYAAKEIKKACLPLVNNEIYSTGTGATHNKYQYLFSV